MDDIQLLYPSNDVYNAPKATPELDTDATLDEQVRALEIRLIQKALATTQDNRTQAAKQLGLSRQGLIKKIERYGLLESRT